MKEGNQTPSEKVKTAIKHDGLKVSKTLWEADTNYMFKFI